MGEISRVKLFGKLNPFAYKAIEGATVFCKLRGNPYVELVHWLHQVLQAQDSDLHHIVRHFNVDAARLSADFSSALDAARRIQTSRAKLDNPNKPVGVFMLCGPSGVGKTETALTLAESLYGGEQNVITIIDGEGRYIDFKNTVIILTSNVGSDEITAMCADPELMPAPDGVAAALRTPLLGRVVVVPYYPLSDEMLGNIVRLQLGRIARRVQDNHGVPFEYDDDVVKLIIARCTELESGGRMIDALLTNTVLPVVSEEFLNPMVQGRALERVAISVADGEFAYSYD